MVMPPAWELFLAEQTSLFSGRDFGQGLSDQEMQYKLLIPLQRHYSLMFVVFGSCTNKMQSAMIGLRPGVSATLSRDGLYRVLPASTKGTFRVCVKSTLKIGVKIFNPNASKHMEYQCGPYPQETIDLPSAAYVNVAAILGRFALPVALSLVRFALRYHFNDI